MGGAHPPEEDEFADLMPGPENYSGRPQPPPQPAPQAAPPRVARAAPTPPPGNVAPAAPAPPAAGAVQSAPPSIPAAGVQSAPPQAPAGGVQSAPPSVPGGVVQAASPAVPGQGVQAAAPAIPGGGAVQSAPPSIPGGIAAAPPSIPDGAGVQAAPASVSPAGVSAAPAGAGLSLEPTAEASADGVSGAPVAGAAAAAPSWGGWTSSPAAYHAQPPVRRAYSAAQAQLALRRDMRPAMSEALADLSDTARMNAMYSRTQIIDGLSDLQHEYADSATGDLLGVDDIKQRITDALINDGAPKKLVADEAGDAIEVVANLFSALLHDALVQKQAKSHLTRLQPTVHRAALVDDEFFESDEHPVRQLINRISQLRDGDSAGDKARHSRVSDVVARANTEFRDDVGVFNDLVSELDEVLEAQEAEYKEKVDAVVEGCEQQQQILESRRGHAADATDTANDRSDLPEEWNKWLERSRKLEVGQRVLMNANSSRAAVVTLVWKEARNNLFVFVDEQGNKASTLTLQQVAMNLRRGVIVVLDENDDEPALDRAMAGVVEQFHSDVEEQATRDPLTGFLLRKYFAEAIDSATPDVEAQAARNAAVCFVVVQNFNDIAASESEEIADELVKRIAEDLKRLVRGKQVAFGRIEDDILGIYWPTGGIESAYKKMQTVLDQLKDINVTEPLEDEDPDATLEFSPDTEADTVARAIRPELIAGICGADDNLTKSDGLLKAAAEACETAREMGAGSIYVATSENEQRRQLELLVGYADQALELDCLSLSAQHVRSLSDDELPPALVIAVGAHDRNDKPIPPHVFGEAVQHSSAAADIDMWVFRKALAWILENEDEAEKFALVLIPLSSASMRNEDLPSLLMGEFMETPVPPGKICFALPDHDVVENPIEAGELIGTLKEFGCRFVLDEFGSGHDNYDYIKTVDVDFVTVKTGFVSDAKASPKDFAMAKSINELVHFMGKKTIAKQPAGADLAETMQEIGIDFLFDLTEQGTLTPAAGTS